MAASFGYASASGPGCTGRRSNIAGGTTNGGRSAGQDSFLASIIYIVGSHIVQSFVTTALVVVADELGDRCP